MQAPKKLWPSPRAERADVKEARAHVLEALRLIEEDPALERECAELRSILQMIDETERE